MSARPRIVCLVGPTASGKTALALELAGRLGAEVVSADSRQVYRRLDIGTAKPTAAERARVPHHCLDLVEPGEVFDAARFRDAASAAIADIVRRRRLPLVVGGTGLYLRALLGGLCPAPPRVPALRAVLERVRAAHGTSRLHRWLTVLDPPAAARIGSADAVRIVRALEVGLTTGIRLSEWQQRHRFADRPLEALVLGLRHPPAELDTRIARRAQAMVDDGFVGEVRALSRLGLAAGAPGLDAVGYREMLACVEGRSDLAGALAATVQATRRFAKRQHTWFRGEPEIEWHEPVEETEQIVARLQAFAGGTAPAAVPA